jgi:cysteinyl-tRNA synthetase
LSIWISNTLSGRKEPFEPIGDVVSMYVCGMTPKFHPHVGHARMYVAADVLRRHLEYRGYQVKHVQNFTDIDDKIIARGEAEGISPEVAAEKYTRSYFEAMQALNVGPAHLYPTVTGSMGAIVEFVQALIELGFAYVADGDVYYAVDRFPEYGKLSGRTAEGQLMGARKELEPGKRDPRDFALWKAAKPGEPAWESPWGPGRPGWHIECSSMVRETLGDQIDIHSGGRDLIFPHHENEIAQSEARTGKKPFARYWPHVGLVTTGGEKMSHSLENFTTIQDIIARYDPMALRLYLLSTHYRSPLAFSEEGLVDKSRALERLRSALEGFEGAPDRPAGWPDAFRQQFVAAMDDDFNTAGALGGIFDLVREINRRRAAGDAEAAAGQALLVELADALGLNLRAAPRPAEGAAEPFIELLLGLRAQLREARQWALADQIRDELRARSVVVEDRAGQTVWRWARPGE